jgi:hypothetical protein
MVRLLKVTGMTTKAIYVSAIRRIPRKFKSCRGIRMFLAGMLFCRSFDLFVLFGERS